MRRLIGCELSIAAEFCGLDERAVVATTFEAMCDDRTDTSIGCYGNLDCQHDVSMVVIDGCPSRDLAYPILRVSVKSAWHKAFHSNAR